MKRILKAIAIALTLTILLTQGALAATSQDVTITATPSFISIANAPGTWTLNGITGDSKIAINTVYYANPLGDTTTPSATVADGECRFTITNTSSVAIDLTVNIGDFSGGDTMTNGNTGDNGATTFGAYSWFSGMTYSGKVIAKSTGSAIMKDALAPVTDIKWGAEIETRTNAWTSATQMTSTMTIIATED